ncbi:enoyl-[acyl-carrier-protein] reductase, mitochondrial-like isoform X1 [Acropora muricata]|uniref:enoyl-[acyl-carrier-protein] reductase, mitochondrial-like isoform X1 n=2 Tax=Acropora millepora TaxID=45264 RepID=UPI001CF4CBC6|nr:enoyl-[acyl-carrier-protein] reductase, mitochondrial-like isoform X1 [Acropora millepora]
MAAVLVRSSLFRPKARQSTSVNLLSRSFNTKSESLVYDEHGDPEKVVRLQKKETNNFGPRSLLLHMLAAPINPADINQIQGTYALGTSLPAVGGAEGTAEVAEVGSEVIGFNKGDQVVLRVELGLGSWRRHLVVSENEVLKIPPGLPVDAAATVSANPCTAFRMLKDFEDLQPGDTVIQNGSNSGVGQAVIQIAATRGVNTVNIVRDRPNIDELKSDLNSLGANYVFTEEDLKSSEMKDLIKRIKPPKLALNCVGGKSSMILFRYLEPKGTMVTYGGMSKQPVTVPTGSLIFNDVKVRGFWMSKWNLNHQKDALRVGMLEEVCKMLQNGQLKPPPCTRYSVENFETAISEAIKPFTNTKQLLILND